MKQLSKATLAALKVELAQYGLTVNPMRSPRNDYLSRLRAWRPETAAGRKAKTTMIKYATMPPVKGVSWYQGPDHVRHYLSGYIVKHPAVVAAQLALPSPQSFGAGWEPDEKVYVLADAAAPVKQIFCS